MHTVVEGKPDHVIDVILHCHRSVLGPTSGTQAGVIKQRCDPQKGKHFPILRNVSQMFHPRVVTIGYLAIFTTAPHVHL
jgi:hypothetical protein